MKYLAITFIALSLCFTACSEKVAHYYNTLYSFIDASMDIVAGDKVQVATFFVSKSFEIEGAPEYTDIEIVADGTTAVENTDFTLSTKRIDFTGNTFGSAAVTLTYNPSFTKGKTLTLRLRYDEHPNITEHMMDTMVITAK